MLLVTFTIDHIMFLSQLVFFFFNNRQFLPPSGIPPTSPNLPQPPPTFRVVLSIFGPSRVTAMSLCMMVDGLGVGPFLRSVAQQTWAQSKPGAVVTWMVRDSQLMEGHGDGG